MVVTNCYFFKSKIQSVPGMKTHSVIPELHTLEAETGRKIKNPLLVDIVCSSVKCC